MKSFTATALAALLSLASAAPTPQDASAAAPAFVKGQAITITQQLDRQDTANQVAGKILGTTPQNPNNLVVEAAVLETGPWCAGFSDLKAQNVVKSINNKMDGIFNSVRTASYGDKPILIGSYWCAATRLEVEQFVAKTGPFAPLASASASTTTSVVVSTTAAAPSSTFTKGFPLTVVQQLDRQDTANQVPAQILGTNANGQNNMIVEAAVLQSGPWCAGFSDQKAQNVVKSINFKQDGIFNSIRPASYGNTPVLVGSYWCAATRLEVEQFVAKIGPFAPKPSTTTAMQGMTTAAPVMQPVMGQAGAATVTVTVTVTAGGEQRYDGSLQGMYAGGHY